MANNTPHANLINSVKASGVERALFDAAAGRLWNAKMACENATKDAFKDFDEQLALARAALDEAEAFHREWTNCPRQRQGKGVQTPAEGKKDG